ncbi:hypothetical protein PLESTB_001492500 [Pleodorina starrii]|uniref:Uncharacterized protein n=1 Tax=Pleodorina starrii TaxID=330485 RepID=A0A9W6BVX6_9CHLO|nr:hypothetical protein PLESTB_001492500 [Pleodorina starrii]
MAGVQAFHNDIPVLDIAPDQAKREARQWLSTYQHLRARTQAVAAEIGSAPTCEALKGKDTSAAAAAASDSALRRLQSEVWTQVDAARLSVHRVNELLAHARPGPAAPVEELAVAIDAAERALAAVRAQQVASLEQLYQQEAHLEAEIADIGARLDADLQADAERAVTTAAAAAAAAAGTGTAAAASFGAGRPASAGPRRPTSRARDRRPSTGGDGGGGSSGPGGRSGGGGGRGGGLAPEVEEYEEFMAEHGPTGGWDPEDHEEFIAILRSCDGDYSHAVAIVLERAIGYSRSEVMAHARWNMELLELEAAKRAALERWRRERQQARAALGAQQALLHSDTAERAQRERQRDQRGREEEAHVGALKKAMAERWRAERAERQRAEAERQRAAAEATAAARRSELEQRQAANKLRLHMAKEAKERQRREEQRRAAAEAAVKAALSAPTPQQLARVAERSAATFQRRQSLLAGQEAQRGRRERVQQQLLDKVHVDVPADPRRLLKGTAAHMQRVQALQAEELKARDSGFILHVSSRVTPTWRAGLQGG